MRRITVVLADYVEEQKRRDRRGGRIVAALAIIAALVIAMSGTTTTTPATGTTGTTRTDTSSTTAPPPAHLVSPAGPLTFRPQLTGTASAAQLVRLRNDGGSPLTLESIAANDAAFGITNDCGKTLAPNDSCGVAVVFAPDAAGKHNAILGVDSSGGRASIALDGEATAIPPVDLGPTNLGRATVGSAAERVVRFTNSGPLPIAIAKAIAPPPFQVSADCATVPPGGGCDVGVVFRPAAPGAASGELTLVNGHGDVVAKSALLGTGFVIEVPPPQLPSITIDPREINFLGDPSTKKIVVTNNGPIPLQLGVKPETPSRYLIDGRDCEASPLQPGKQCAIVVDGRFAVRLGASTRIVISYAGRSEVVPVFAKR